VPPWIRSSCRARPGITTATTVLTLALLLGAGRPVPVTAQSADPEGVVWTVPPGDAEQIQEALDAARAAGGGAVYLPGAVYLLAAKVRVHSNVTLFGDGMDKTILRWATDAPRDHMMSNGSQTSGNANIQIRDLTLDGERYPSGQKDCCFGLRLNNVRDSYVINVAAVGHSKDGIYLGHAGAGGAVNVRVNGCRAAYNFRNGISLVEGDNVTIDHCLVEKNNLTKQVAGIDVEPDEGQSVTNSKLIADTVTGQDVGIKLHVPHNGYATVANTAVCRNTVVSNRGAGIADQNTSHSVYVENNTGGDRKKFQVGSGALVGSRYADACRLPALPAGPTGPAPAPADAGSG